MKKKTDREDQTLRGIWKNHEKSFEKEYLNTTTMETYLNKATSEFGDRLKLNILIDMAFKGMMSLGFVFVGILYFHNVFVLVTSGLFLSMGALVLWREKQMVDALNAQQDHSRGLSELVAEKLSFYNSYAWKYPLFLALSPAMFYVLGSFIYHALTYGEIHPIKDLQDAIVLGALLVAGVAISLLANLPYFRRRIKSLSELKSDVGNTEAYADNVEKIKLRKERDLFKYLLLVLLGVIVLIILLLRFN